MNADKKILDQVQLGDSGLGASYDDANAFGLDEYGGVASNQRNPVWGVLAAGGVGTLTAVAVRQLTTKDKWAEVIGLGAGVAATVPMMFIDSMKAAGWIGATSAVMNHVPRILEQFLSPKEKAKVEAVSPSATTTTPPTEGVELFKQKALSGQGGGMGLVTAEVIRALNGAGGGSDHAELPNLLGNALAQAQGEMKILGGPQLSAVAGRFGSTHFNKH